MTQYKLELCQVLKILLCIILTRGQTVVQFNNLDPECWWHNNMTASCGAVGSSTCRQNYSWADAATVFMYRYTGPDIRVRPSACNNSTWAGQCMVFV